MSGEAVDQAVSRARAWTILGELLLHGPAAPAYAIIGQIPVFASALPGGVTADQLGAEHHRVFGFEVFPFESVFCGEEGKLGGEVSESVRAAYSETGFPPPQSDVESDHLGVECLFLGTLCAHEATALDQRSATLDAIRETQRRFLDEHFLTWLPPMVAAVRDVDSPFWQAVVEMCLELGVEQRRGLGEATQRPMSRTPQTLSALLERPETRLKDVAQFMLVPANFGCFLGRKAIGELAKAADGPPGFGGRFQLLESSMFGAIDRGNWFAFVDAIDVLAQSHREVLTELQALGVPVEGWLQRLEISAAGLTMLRNEDSSLLN